uniref:Uncharacterized protein n=1 Tax=Oryza brachyantha TaxID=4533 RepID=J3KXM3_ORYBR
MEIYSAERCMEKQNNQQGILEVNHVMTWSGALTSSTATSSSTVTHRQHGQMHEIGSLRKHKFPSPHRVNPSIPDPSHLETKKNGRRVVVTLPDDPDDGADEGDDDGEEREGQAEQPPDRPAVAAAAAHLVTGLVLPTPPPRRASATLWFVLLVPDARSNMSFRNSKAGLNELSVSLTCGAAGKREHGTQLSKLEFEWDLEYTVYIYKKSLGIILLTAVILDSQCHVLSSTISS